MHVAEEELLRELDRLRHERKLIERRREDLVRKAKQLQAKTQSRRNAGQYTVIDYLCHRTEN